MASFAKSTFNVVNYLASRPTYPTRIYDIILAFHKLNDGRFDRALDLGCGPGFVALNLAPHSQHVTALDPAQKMVSIGLQPDPKIPRIDYRVGNAEELTQAGIGSGDDGVDLIVAGQAAHWFDYPKVWREFTTHVRPGGTVAFIGYAELQFPNHPGLTPLITHHARSPSALGPYWPAGRSIVESLLDPIPFPIIPTTHIPLSSVPNLSSDGPIPEPSQITEPTLPAFNDDFDFTSWDSSTAVRLKEHKHGKPYMMEKMFTLDTLEGYLRTFSALHEYHERNPDDAEKKGRGGEEGDIVDRLIGKIGVGLRKEGKKGGEKEGEISGGWPLVLMMIKKKP